MNKLFLSLLMLAALPLFTLAQSGFSQYRNKNRLLLVFAPSRADPRWRTQNTLLAGSAADFQERDLRRFDYLEHGGDKGAAIRSRYGVMPGQFRVLLIGKDGHVASEAAVPVTASNLAQQIDRMPMRREEMKREEMRRRQQPG